MGCVGLRAQQAAAGAQGLGESSQPVDVHKLSQLGKRQLLENFFKKSVVQNLGLLLNENTNWTLQNSDYFFLAKNRP